VQDSEIVAHMPVASVARGVGHDNHVDPAVSRFVRHGGWVVMAIAWQWQFTVNALFHLTAWMALGDYAPGVGTGAVVSIPATGHFFVWVRRQARATAAELILAVAVGTVVAAVASGFLFLP
jgi:uncharacterized membrane-anchored protein YitT (DUF2179 family)